MPSITELIVGCEPLEKKEELIIADLIGQCEAGHFVAGRAL